MLSSSSSATTMAVATCRRFVVVFAARPVEARDARAPPVTGAFLFALATDPLARTAFNDDDAAFTGDAAPRASSSSSSPRSAFAPRRRIASRRPVSTRAPSSAPSSARRRPRLLTSLARLPAALASVRTPCTRALASTNGAVRTNRPPRQSAPLTRHTSSPASSHPRVAIARDVRG